MKLLKFFIFLLTLVSSVFSKNSSAQNFSNLEDPKRPCGSISQFDPNEAGGIISNGYGEDGASKF